MADQATGLVADLEARRSAVERELEEIELLMRQARTEADRHAARRDAAGQRLSGLMDESAVPPALREAQEQLMLQYQRSALMSSQIEVLEGKQRVLERLREALVEAGGALAGVAPAGGGQAGAGSTRTASLPAPAAPGAGSQSRAVLTAQEEMRRAIARQMHDGPAQSIANIALQAEVVQRLLTRDPTAAERELGELRTMVQHALEATKTFIFEVRPMVLDDLGLVPTLRRAAGERQRRSGVAVRFESTGADSRLDAEVETHLFRIVDDAMTALLSRRPTELSLRLNWTESAVTASLRTRPPAGEEPPRPAQAPAGGDVPTALAQMIREQDAGVVERETARRRAYALPAETLADLEQRGGAVGIEVREHDDGLRVDMSVKVANGTTT